MGLLILWELKEQEILVLSDTSDVLFVWAEKAVDNLGSMTGSALGSLVLGQVNDRGFLLFRGKADVSSIFGDIDRVDFTQDLCHFGSFPAFKIFPKDCLA